MWKFLRYNSRHHFYWHLGGGGRKMGWPQMDPIGSSYGGGQRVISWHEPLWLFRLRERLFAHAGRQKCGRRGEGWHGHTDKALPDTWDIGPDGNRTCSWCGSIHFDDLMEICAKALVDPAYGVEGTDKQYKVYVRQPGVVNASQGAIKFYMAHAPEHPTDAQQQLYREALVATNKRRREMMDAKRKPSK